MTTPRTGSHTGGHEPHAAERTHASVGTTSIAIVLTALTALEFAVLIRALTPSWSRCSS
jgi:hypothetical protein